MEVQVKEWGNSQGIRLPKSVLQEAGFALDENLTVEVDKGKIILLFPNIYWYGYPP